jgi:DNA repair exonuclease SbcCD ATPase subunit
MLAAFKERCSSWIVKNNDALQGLGSIIEKGGRVVPIFGAPVVAFGAALQYVGEMYEKEQKRAEELQREFDELSEHLKILAEHLPDLEKRIKDESQVVEQMRVLFVDIDKWAYLITKSKKPPSAKDLIDSMRRKNARLKQCIEAETWATVLQISSKVDEIKVVVVRPATELYDEGKNYFVSKQYIEAEKAFKEYQRLIQIKSSEARVPDNSQQYLADIWDKLQEIQMENFHCLHSQVSPVNPYRKVSKSSSATPPPMTKQGSLPSTPASAPVKQSSLPSVPAVAPSKPTTPGGLVPTTGPSRTAKK